MSESDKPRRPLVVWLIFLWFTYALAHAALTYTTGSSRSLTGRSFPVTISLAEKMIRGSIIVLEFAAALELFRMRRVAVALWFASSIAFTMLALYDIATILHRHSRHSVLLAAIFVALLAIVWLIAGYANRLHGRGRLRPGV